VSTCQPRAVDKYSRAPEAHTEQGVHGGGEFARRVRVRATVVESATGPAVEGVERLRGVEIVREMLAQPGDRIVVFGSFLIVGPALALLAARRSSG